MRNGVDGKPVCGLGVASSGAGSFVAAKTRETWDGSSPRNPEFYAAHLRTCLEASAYFREFHQGLIGLRGLQKEFPFQA